MSFKAEGVVIQGGIQVTGASAQVAPQGTVSASYDARTNRLSLANSISDGNGIVPTPN